MVYRILFILSFVFTNTLIAQQLISYEKIDAISANDAASDFGVDSEYDQDIYKVLYYTEHLSGEQDTASGLICVPLGFAQAFPIVVYQHGTVDNRESVPSRMSDFQIGSILASLGYIAVMPDYIGLGDSKGLHPYIHADSESSAAADLILAAREMQSDLQFYATEQLFITGYSQGGHASAALHRDIEAGRFDGLNAVTAASHMSGPYSVSERMPEFTLGEDNYFFTAYLAWVTLSMKAAYPELLADYEIEDIFREEYVNDIRRFENEEIGLFFLNVLLVGILQSNNNGTIQPRNMLKPDILDALFNDPDHPLTQALADNDLHDWAPEAPTRLMYCQGDDQVTFENSIYAEETMQANGATDVLAVNHGNLDHGGCVNPATEATIEFFKQYQEVQFVLDVEDVDSDCDVQCFTSGNQLRLKIEQSCFDKNAFQVVNLQGQVLLEGWLEHNQEQFDVTDFLEGIYFFRISGEGGSMRTFKFLVN